MKIGEAKVPQLNFNVCTNLHKDRDRRVLNLTCDVNFSYVNDR